jgi:hypothetical protein
MTGVSIERVLQESSFAGRPLEDPALERLRQAILVEDVLGIVLSDEQLAGCDLSDPTVLRALASEPVLQS